MHIDEIKKLSEKKFTLNNLDEIKKDYEISFGKYENHELKKCIDNKKPFYLKNNFIVGYKNNIFLSDKDEEIKVERLVKAVIVEDVKEEDVIEENIPKTGDYFTIIGRNDWDRDIDEFEVIFKNLEVGEIYLPPHSAIFNFIKPTEKEIKEKIVSCLEGVNVNIYSKDNYIDNIIHEIGHLFWRDCVKYDEKKQFKNHFDHLKPSAIYEYDWEKSNEEEVFCTIYKWYVKSQLLNRSFYNILEYEDREGLRLLQNIMDRIGKDKLIADIWELNKQHIFDYLNPKLDITTGKKLVRKGLFEDIENIEVPNKLLNNVNKFENGTMFINLDKAIVPINKNKIDHYYKMEKAEKAKPIIYFDMDGVIVDFVKGYKQAFDRNAYNDDPFTIKQFCMEIPHFFRMLPINEQGLELFNYLRNDYDIKFLTTPMKDMIFCKVDKIEWIRENLGDYDVFFSNDKSEYVTDKQNILIDDMKYNLDPWNEAGGTAIKFPQKLDKIVHIIEETFNPTKEIKKIKSQLKNMVVNTELSEAQKESGIYKKGVVDFKGLNIKIENPKNSIRWGFDEKGKKWISRMKCHYGYITGTEGSDFDPVDCFIGPDLNRSLAFVVNQGKDGLFDEHKVMLGFDSLEEAEKAYLSNYEKGWNGLDSIKQTNTKKLREWLRNGNMLEPY